MADSKKYDGSQWEHSLRKLTTATETIQSGDTIYADGQPITTYILKGNEEHTGTPSPQNPVMPQGTGDKTANLFNATVEQGSITSSGDIEASNRVRTKEYIDVPTGDIAISWNSSQNTDLYIMTYNASGTYINGVGWKTSPATITISGNEAKIRLIWRYNSQADITPSAITNVMINSGSTALPYEPYGYKIPISTLQGSAVNYLGSVQSTRQIKKFAFTGQENITTYSQIGGRYRYSVGMPLMDTTDTPPIRCTHFRTDYTIQELNANTVNNALATFQRILYFYTTDYATVTEFKEFLTQQYANGTPVTVYYVLATAETAAVNEPLMKIGTYADSISDASPIPTADGANSITVDTTVQPSEFTATWTGWHDSSVKEWDGSQWQ